MGRDASDPSAGLGSNVGASSRNQETAADSFCLRAANRAGERHGMEAFSLTDKMQMKETDLAAHLPVCMHLCETRANESSARSEAAEQHRKKRGTERRREQ